jgi:hypothetical protein
MCGGGGGSKKAAPPVNMGYTYSPADESNQRKQALAVAPDAGKPASYGSELGAAPAAPAMTGAG